MFFHPHLMDSFFGNGHALQDSMRLVSALAVECELQDSRRREIEQSEVNRQEATQRESGTTAPLKRNR